MRTQTRLAIALVMALPVMLLTDSCSKTVVQSEVQTQPVSTAQPAATAKPEIRPAADEPAKKAAQAAQPENVRPAADAAAHDAGEWVFLNEHIHFAFASSLLSDEARQVLYGKAEYLRTHPGVTVTVEGHCDDRGTNAYNLVLGERRAVSVKIFLVDLGIATDRLNTMSFGKDRPVAAGHDEESWARNRRAQFVIN